MKRKFIVLSMLSVLVIALGIAVPAYMSREQPTLIGGPFHTPRPTSTHFSEPLTEIVEVVAEEESQTEAPDEGTNCTYPLYYWSDYPDSWPSQIIIAGQIYTREDIFDIYHTGNPDAATLLIQELYTAFLNILGGASHARIDPVIVDANNWLEANPPGLAVSELNQQIGMNLATALEAYNTGRNGPPPCDDVPPTPTPSATITATRTPTNTSTPTPPRRIVTTPSFDQPQSENQPAPPAPPQPTATQIIPTPIVVLPTRVITFPTQQLVPPTAAPTSTPWIILPTSTNLPLPIPPTATYTSVPPIRTNTPRPLSTNTPVPPTSTVPTNTPVPPTNTNTPVPPTITNTPVPPTITNTPVPTDTETPVPTETPTEGLLPTRNPNYASPTPTETSDLPTGDDDGEDLDQQLLYLDPVIETLQSIQGGN